MPLIRVQLSVEIDEAKQSKLMSELSSTVAGALGKPEGYVERQVSGWTEEAGSYAAFDASNLFNLISIFPPAGYSCK